MTRYIAFLRAINVGGRVVTMARLRDVFAGLGFRGVETFIASGNVVFESNAADTAALERKIERALGAALGYEVATFVRTPAEVAAIARYEPFPAGVLSGAAALNVGFMAAAPAEAALRGLEALGSTCDQFHVNGRELYWLLEKKQSESKISNGVLERAVKARATFRGINTIRRLDAKLSGAPVNAPARDAGAPAGRPARPAARSGAVRRPPGRVAQPRTRKRSS
jgi:uncharacterized protein (DUF1697 family)